MRVWAPCWAGEGFSALGEADEGSLLLAVLLRGAEGPAVRGAGRASALR